MNYKLSLIIVLFCLIVLAIIFHSNKIEKFTTKFVQPHNKETCDDYPFENDECAFKTNEADYHVDRYKYANGIGLSRNIHYVDPTNSCCLRTCINDFTYTEDNTNTNNLNRIGEYRKEIPIDLFFSSNCAKCMINFETSLNMLKEPNKHSNEVVCKEETQ